MGSLKGTDWTTLQEELKNQETVSINIMSDPTETEDQQAVELMFRFSSEQFGGIFDPQDFRME